MAGKPPVDLRPFVSVQVTADECDGSFERMLRRFVRRTRESGVIDEVRERSRGFVKRCQRNRRRTPWIEKIAPR